MQWNCAVCKNEDIETSYCPECDSDMPEDTPEQIIDKIALVAWEIRCNWEDPRGHCRQIVALCKKLKGMSSQQDKEG